MKRFIKILLALLLGTAVVLGALYAINVFKLSYYRIETGSMTPDYPVGTLVVDSGTAGFKPGQPISFVAEGKVVTHVFLGYRKDGSLVTRGIANPSADQWSPRVYPRDVRGRVLFQIRALAPEFWLSRTGALTLLGLLLIVAGLLWRRHRAKVEPVRRTRGRHVAV